MNKYNTARAWMFCNSPEWTNKFVKTLLWFIAAQTVCWRGASPGAGPTLLPLPEEPTVVHLHVYWRWIKEWWRTRLLQNAMFISHAHPADLLCLLLLIRWKGGLLYCDVAEEVSHNVAGQWDSRLSNHQDDEEPACCSGLENSAVFSSP